MTEIITLLSGSWHWIIGIAATLAALWVSYKGGKKIGTVETQAKADVTAAKVQSEQVASVAKQQSENTEKVNSVKQANAALSDDAQRNKLRQSQFNSDD